MDGNERKLEESGHDAGTDAREALKQARMLMSNARELLSLDRAGAVMYDKMGKFIEDTSWVLHEPDNGPGDDVWWECPVSECGWAGDEPKDTPPGGAFPWSKWCPDCGAQVTEARATPEPSTDVTIYKCLECRWSGEHPNRRKGFWECPECGATYDDTGDDPMDAVREAVLKRVEELRGDEEFQTRLKASIERDQPILDALAPHDGPTPDVSVATLDDWELKLLRARDGLRSVLNLHRLGKRSDPTVRDDMMHAAQLALDISTPPNKETPVPLHQGGPAASSLGSTPSAGADPAPSTYIQYLVDFLDNEGLLEEGCFTFPEGTTWWATGKEPAGHTEETEAR